MTTGWAGVGPDIQKPEIPQKIFSISDYGAKGDGTTNDGAAIQAAIDAAQAAGGGRVVIPAGKFLSGPIELRSKIDLHLEKGTILLMSQNVDEFPVQDDRRENFISGAGLHDIRISGEGVIDGQGETWWEAFLQTKGTGDTGPRRPQLILLSECERVEISGITTKNPPNTHCSLRECRDIVIRGITMEAPDESPNTDALNLNLAKNALIESCRISTGDDNIVLLGSKGDAKSPGVENITIRNCQLGFGHGLSIGSYTSGHVRNVRVENVSFDKTTSCIRIKTARDRGGIVENISYRDITIEGSRYPIFISAYYPKEPKTPGEPAQTVGPKTPTYRNITIENVAVTGSKNSIILWGVPEQPISGVTLRNVKIESELGAFVLNAKNVQFTDVTVKAESGPELRVFNAEVAGMQGEELPGDEPIKFK